MALLKFGTAKAGRGRKSLGKLYVKGKSNKITLPVAVINGKKEGNKAVIIANQHGREKVGVEALRRLYEKLDPKKFAGSLYLVFSCNPEAALRSWDCWPESMDEKDGLDYYTKNNLNFSWTGNKDGRLSERVTSAIWDGAVTGDGIKPAIFVDVHCHGNPTAVYAEDRLAADIGVIGGAEVTVRTRQCDAVEAGRETHSGSNILCYKNGIPSITFELDNRTPYICNEVVTDGIRVLENILKFYNCINGKPVYPEQVRVLDPWFTHFDKKAKKGDVSYRKDKYGYVKKGDVIVEVLDPRTGQIVQTCKAKMNGAIYALTFEPVCNKGDRLYGIAKVHKYNPALYAAKNRKRILKGL
ncbi:MAG: succinylglutamate desuccinylase/aspartoacylase family protein [Planctomycetota bacterium]